jgi:hypothetical protein
MCAPGVVRLGTRVVGGALVVRQPLLSSRGCIRYWPHRTLRDLPSEYDTIFWEDPRRP